MYVRCVLAPLLVLLGGCVVQCNEIGTLGLHTTVRMHPIHSFELLFFAVFGQTTTEQTQVDKFNGANTSTQPYWVEYLFKIVFGVYMLVSVVVLINLLIAMMSDTYQRIQVVYCYSSHPYPVSIDMVVSGNVYQSNTYIFFTFF